MASYTPWTFDAQFAPGLSPLDRIVESDWASLGIPRTVSIRRGRQDDLDQFEAGRMDITLDNEDESLDHLLSSSDIYDTDALPFTPMRLVATKGNEEWVIFTGYTLDGFSPQGLRGGGTVLATVIDWLGWATQIESQDSVWGTWVAYCKPTVWMRGQTARTYTNVADNPDGIEWNAAAIYTGAGGDMTGDPLYPDFVYRLSNSIVTGSSMSATFV